MLAAAATVCSALYLVAYLWVIDAQNGAVAWVVPRCGFLATLSCASAAAGILARAVLAVGLITSALSTVVALVESRHTARTDRRGDRDCTRSSDIHGRKRACCDRQTTAESTKELISLALPYGRTASGSARGPWFVRVAGVSHERCDVAGGIKFRLAMFINRNRW